MQNYDGQIVIGTVVDDSGFDDGVKGLEKNLDKMEKNVNVDVDVDTENSTQKVAEFIEMLRYLVNNNKTKIELNLNNKNAVNEMNKIFDQMNDIVNRINNEMEINPDFNETDLLKYVSEIDQLSLKLDELDKSGNKLSFSNIERSLDNINNKIGGVIKSVARWGIAIFGVRSAYNLLTSSISTISQYNEQIGTDIAYIRYLIASTLQPIIETIIKMVYQLLSYIGLIAKAWFGVNLFANASTEAFQKNNKVLGNSVKQAKELKKQLTGFDEMNVLQDNGNVTSGGGGGGVSMPSFDPTLFQGEVPEWLQWILDNGPAIAEILGAIAVGLLALAWGLSPLQALGAAIFTYEVMQLIEDIKTLIEDPSWENFANVLKDIGGAMMGLGLIIGGTVGTKIAGVGLIIWGVVDGIQALMDYFSDLDGSLENNGTSWEQFGRILTDIALIIGGIGILTGGLPWLIAAAVGLIVGLVLSNWTKISNVLKKAESFIKDILNKIEQKFGIFGSLIKGAILAVVDYIKDKFASIFLPIKNIFDGILLIVKGDFQNGIKSIGKGIANHFIGVLNTLIDGINFTATPLRALIVALGKVMGKQYTMDNIKIPRIKYLAKGGIINLPGRGVPIGNAFVGERDAEGVIPLTDSQQMEMLGEAIGRYITVNTILNNYMNSRLISREIKKSDNEENFAFNN